MDGETNYDEPNQASSASREAMHADTVNGGAAANTAAPASIKEEYKIFGIIGYLTPILFFLPMLQDKMKHDPYVRFHMNQQLILLVVGFLLWFIGDYFLIMIFGYLGFKLMQVVQLGLLVLAVMGILNVWHGEEKALPIIGGFTLLQ